MIGLHYFSPVDKMPLVEVIPHAGTSEETIATTVALAQAGQDRHRGGRQRRFYVNRILAPYINEAAARCLLEGEPIESLDKALVDFGFPVGPITLLDEVGIDVGTKIIPVLVEALGPRRCAGCVRCGAERRAQRAQERPRLLSLPERRAAAAAAQTCGYLIVYAARRHAEGAHAAGDRRSTLRDDDAERSGALPGRRRDPQRARRRRRRSVRHRLPAVPRWPVPLYGRARRREW